MKLNEVINEQISFQIKAKKIDYKRLIARVESSYTARLDDCIQRVLSDEVAGARLLESIECAIEKGVKENPMFVMMDEMGLVNYND